MNIRMTNDSDLEDILNVHRAAFADEGEIIATLVRELLQDPSAQPMISLLAEQKKQVVGHVLFTQAWVEQTPASLLAPLAVMPDRQRQGIGNALVKTGLRALTEADMGLAFVLGHPSYYPRFGFTPAGIQGFEASYPILEKNANAWMVLELKANALSSVSGKVKCAKAIDKPEYWQE